jgi:hypothetical protein
VKESEKARKNPTQAGHGLAGAARTATWAHSSRGRLALGLGLRLAAVGVVSSQRQTVAMVHKAGHRHRFLRKELCQGSLPRQRTSGRALTDPQKGLAVIGTQAGILWAVKHHVMLVLHSTQRAVGANPAGPVQPLTPPSLHPQPMLCYTCLTSAFGTITVPRRRGIGPMQLRRKRAHPCCSRSQQTGTGWPSKRGTHQASSARESKPGPAHPHRAEVKMHDAASTREGKQPCTQSMMTRMQSKEICERVRKGKEESNASRARAGRGRENGDVGPLKPGPPRAGAGAQTRCCGCRLQC